MITAERGLSRSNLAQPETRADRVSAQTEKPRIIYVPDAHNFIFGDFPFTTGRHIQNPETQALKRNYERLRRQVDLPERVGVITYLSMIKAKSQNDRSEMEHNCEMKLQTTYLPLEVLRQMFKVKEELEKDPDDLLMHEYFYRSMMALISYGHIGMDRRTTSKQNYTLMLISSLPKVRGAGALTVKVSDILEKSAADTANAKLTRQAAENVELMRQTLRKFPSWSTMEELGACIDARFAANKVSEGFPLHFQPQGWFSPMLYEVSLVEKIEVSSGYEQLLNMLRLGCQANGQSGLPVEMMEEIDRLYKKDRFGETNTAAKFGDLLSGLPSPRTIITDIYIADAIPEIATIDFEACEVRLPD